MEGSPANRVCSFRAVEMSHAHVPPTHGYLPLLGGKTRGIDSDYVYDYVVDDVEFRSSVGVCGQPVVRPFVYTGYSSVRILHLLRSD